MQCGYCGGPIGAVVGLGYRGFCCPHHQVLYNTRERLTDRPAEDFVDERVPATHDAERFALAPGVSFPKPSLTVWGGQCHPRAALPSCRVQGFSPVWLDAPPPECHEQTATEPPPAFRSSLRTLPELRVFSLPPRRLPGVPPAAWKPAHWNRPLIPASFSAGPETPSQPAALPGFRGTLAMGDLPLHTLPGKKTLPRLACTPRESFPTPDTLSYCDAPRPAKPARVMEKVLVMRRGRGVSRSPESRPAALEFRELRLSALPLSGVELLIPEPCGFQMEAFA